MFWFSSNDFALARFIKVEQFIFRLNYSLLPHSRLEFATKHWFRVRFWSKIFLIFIPDILSLAFIRIHFDCLRANDRFHFFVVHFLLHSTDLCVFRCFRFAFIRLSWNDFQFSIASMKRNQTLNFSHSFRSREFHSCQNVIVDDRFYRRFTFAKIAFGQIKIVICDLIHFEFLPFSSFRSTDSTLFILFLGFLDTNFIILQWHRMTLSYVNELHSCVPVCLSMFVVETWACGQSLFASFSFVWWRNRLTASCDIKSDFIWFNMLTEIRLYLLTEWERSCIASGWKTMKSIKRWWSWSWIKCQDTNTYTCQLRIGHRRRYPASHMRNVAYTLINVT